MAPHFSAKFRRGRELAIVEARSNAVFARHFHAEFGIGLLTDGAQRSWSGRGAVEAVRGDVITVNPGEVHDGAPLGGERAWSMLYIAPSIIGSIVADITEGGLMTRELHAPVVTDVRIGQLFSAAHRAVTTDSDAVEENLLLLFAALMRMKSTSSVTTPPGLALVRERIDDVPEAPHPLSELASLAGMSRFQLLRGFNRITGLTPHSYVIQRRLELARRRICDGVALAAASVEAGFADQSHFHRAFVARYGLTPGAYSAAANR